MQRMKLSFGGQGNENGRLFRLNLLIKLAVNSFKVFSYFKTE